MNTTTVKMCSEAISAEENEIKEILDELARHFLDLIECENGIQSNNRDGDVEKVISLISRRQAVCLRIDHLQKQLPVVVKARNERLCDACRKAKNEVRGSIQQEREACIGRLRKALHPVLLEIFSLQWERGASHNNFDLDIDLFRDEISKALTEARDSLISQLRDQERELDHDFDRHFLNKWHDQSKRLLKKRAESVSDFDPAIHLEPHLKG
jgi:hypothetical protein